MGEESEPSKKKKWTQKEGLTYGMALGQQMLENFRSGRKKNPLDHSIPKWKKFIKAIPGWGWFFIVVGILFLYGYLASFM